MAKKCDVTLGSETQTGETRLPVPQSFIRTILVNIGIVSRDYMILQDPVTIVTMVTFYTPPALHRLTLPVGAKTTIMIVAKR